MRPPFRRRHLARQRQPAWPSTLISLMTLAPSLSQAINFTPAPSADLDFSSLGRVGFAGDFDGISLYEYEGQGGSTFSSNGSESVVTQLPNGALTSLVSTDASIRAMCMFTRSNGEMQGVIIAGNFTSMDDTRSTAIALFNPNTTDVTPLDGLQGEVHALLCDEDQDTVYVGGSFKGANSTNAIAWVGTDGWTNLPFAGFNGPVEAITKTSNGHIIFGGSFTGLGNASTPTERDGQTINLSTAKISADNSASSDGFDNPKNIVCSDGSDASGSVWLAKDNTPAVWEAQFDFGFEPTKLRLLNTHHDGRGTKTFRMVAVPDGGIMNLTYIDPKTQANMSCTSECPLINEEGAGYQDFRLVNRVGMDHFQIAISDWYGSGAGLGGIQLLQDNIFAYAINEFNEPSCGSVEMPSSATKTGPWRESPSLQSNSKYLTVKLDGNVSPKSASVVFSPNIKESGNYSIDIYTPGCKPDDTCSTRGRVNITGVMSSGGDDSEFTTSLYQTNDFYKYDQIYFGYIEKTSDSFRPTVTISPLADQNIDAMTFVAQRVGFTLMNSTGGLNGLFDFNPEKAVVDTTDLESSAINKLGASFDRSTGVRSLVTSGDVTYIGGNFTSDEHVNIVAIDKNKKVKSLDGGLNGEVNSMYLNGSKLYVGGQFTNTLTDANTALKHVAVYDVDSDEWKALGGGVDGTVEHVVPMNINTTEGSPETVIVFSGSFSQCIEFDDSDAITVDGFAIWVPSQSNWVQNLNGTLPNYSGVLTAALLDLPQGQSILAGSMSSSQISANGAASLGEDGLGQFPVKIQGRSPSSQNRRRDLISGTDVSGVVSGVFYDEDDHNITVLAGHFSAQTNNGSTVDNLVVIDGDDNDSINGLPSDISADSTFFTVALQGSTLFAGGKVSGTIHDNRVNGLLSYDIVSKSFGNQPPSVSGKNGTVSAITVRPDSSEVYVGGSFDKAGALDCPGICLFDTGVGQWTRPGGSMGGDVNALLWTSKNELVAGGNLSSDGSSQRYMAIYDVKKGQWTTLAGSDDLPGPVLLMTPASADNKQIWVAGVSTDDGSTYLMKYDGKDWLTAKPSLSSDSAIRGLQVFSLTKGHDKTDLLDEKQALMITGSINIPGIGKSGAALYNGTAFQPYALTTGSGSSSGSIAHVFSQKDNFFSTGGKHLALVFVVLIGLAIALGLILLLVLGGIILDRIRKKREGYVPAPTSMYDRGRGMRDIPPGELFSSLGKGRGGAPRV